MSKTDLRARLIYHHKKDSIEAHLTIVFAALAVACWLERQTGWSIKKLVTALRRYRKEGPWCGRAVWFFAGVHSNSDDAGK
jgi:hypothetical protein